MASIVSLHSFRGGTGKSNLAANIAFLAARGGRSVGVLDTDLQSPGVHVILGLPQRRIVHTLTEFLTGKCEVIEAAYELSGQLNVGDGGGRLFLIPSSMKTEDITQIVANGYDAERLNGQFETLISRLGLDLLLIDTHPGLSRETMLTTAVCDTLSIVMRPDQQDVQGTAVLVELAKRLRVPRIMVTLNKLFGDTDSDELVASLSRSYDCEIVGKLPFRENLARLGSKEVFAASFPDDPFVRELEVLVDALLAPLANDLPRTLSSSHPEDTERTESAAAHLSGSAEPRPQAGAGRATRSR